MEPSRGKSICVAFEREEHYAACVADAESFRQQLTQVFGQQPELCPAGIVAGFVRQDKRGSLQQQRRRRELQATAGVFLGRPSFRRPSRVGGSAAGEKALSLRHGGVPFDALVSVCGQGPQCARASRRASHGRAVDLPPLRRALSPRRPDSSLALPRPPRLRVPSHLAPQPAHRLLQGRSQPMTHELR